MPSYRITRKQNRKRERQTDTCNLESVEVSPVLDENKMALQNVIKQSMDIVYYEFETLDKQRYLTVYYEELINQEILDREVAGAILRHSKAEENIKKNITEEYLKAIINITNITAYKQMDEVIKKILNGDVILFAEGMDVSLCMPLQSWKERGITEPTSEIITRGPREGFVETLKTNRSLLRRKIKNPNLVFEALEMGKQTNSAINIAYIEDIVNEDILAELKRRLQKIDIDAILDTGYIEELIRDEQFSPFNTVGYTERPDVVAAKLLEGRIAILCDGSPVALTVPNLFIEMLQINEDYYSNYFLASINRILRSIAFLLTVFVPGLYVALMTNHLEIIPPKLLFSLIAAKSGTPFPTVIEILVMIVIFELLRESGLRLPRGLGQTVSIVGALVLGQAAVEAKFISAPVVIVIAVTAITSFVFYHLNGAIIIARLIAILLGAMFGLYGIILSVISIFMHMFSLQSFGIPYMSYIGALKGQELKDTIIREPWWYMYIRPRLISSRNYIRKGRVQKS